MASQPNQPFLPLCIPESPERVLRNRDNVNDGVICSVVCLTFIFPMRGQAPIEHGLGCHFSPGVFSTQHRKGTQRQLNKRFVE